MICDYFFNECKNDPNNFKKGKWDDELSYWRDSEYSEYSDEISEDSHGCYSIDYYSESELKESTVIPSHDNNKNNLNNYNDIYIHYNCNGYCKYDCKNLIFICGATYPVQYNKHGKITQYKKCGHTAYNNNEIIHECKGSNNVRFNSKKSNDYYCNY